MLAPRRAAPGDTSPDVAHFHSDDSRLGPAASQGLALPGCGASVPLPYLAVILCLAHLPEELGLPFCSLPPSTKILRTKPTAAPFHQHLPGPRCPHPLSSSLHHLTPDETRPGKRSTISYSHSPRKQTRQEGQAQFCQADQARHSPRDPP